MESGIQERRLLIMGMNVDVTCYGSIVKIRVDVVQNLKHNKLFFKFTYSDGTKVIQNVDYDRIMQSKYYVEDGFSISEENIEIIKEHFTNEFNILLDILNRRTDVVKI